MWIMRSCADMMIWPGMAICILQNLNILNNIIKCVFVCYQLERVMMAQEDIKITCCENGGVPYRTRWYEVTCCGGST